MESRALHAPALGATWSEVGGTYAMFDGVGSPLTQTFGLGLFAAPSADDLQALEDFFRARGAEVFHEVSPLADPALLPLLVAWLPSHRAHHGVAPPARRRIAAGRLRAPARRRPHHTPHRQRRALRLGRRLGARMGEFPELAAFMRDFGMVTGSSRGVSCFVAELDGAIIATGAIAIHGGVALLAGASTIPSWRGRGAQGRCSPRASPTRAPRGATSR
ncbi:MAG: hypothetical protein IPK33_12990 [Gemmatimonadetes bacterium]|nr:hypothetical protein [Gemmatimonadota bacterium]